jgi:hypothetical protein
MIPLDKGHHWMREEVSMPEVYRKFDVVFSKETVAHVEGEAIVTLLIGHKDIA